jgi:hypothetical protein
MNILTIYVWNLTTTKIGFRCAAMKVATMSAV